MFSKKKEQEKEEEGEKNLLLLASHEYRINHLPSFLVSVQGPEDGGNKTSPSGTCRQV